MRDHPNTGGGVMAGLIDGDPTGAVPADANPSAAPRTATEWEWARRRVEKKHKLRAAVAAYVVINAFLIGAWAAASGRVGSWPVGACCYCWTRGTSTTGGRSPRRTSTANCAAAGTEHHSAAADRLRRREGGPT
jgi:hypothetical protein